MSWFRRFRPARRGKSRGGLEGGAADTAPGRAERSATGRQLAQINVRGDAELIARFRTLCRAERRTYADMLAVLLHAYERRDDSGR